MKLLLVVFLALLSMAVVACGSDSTDSSGRSLPPTNGQYDRVLQLAKDSVETPDFTLNSASGDVVRLSDLRGDGPLVVVFYRGLF